MEYIIKFCKIPGEIKCERQMLMNRSDYRKIAKTHGVSIKEVKRDMQEAVNETYKKPTFHAKCVYSEGEKPTVDEFIDHIARRAKSGVK